MCVTNYPTPEPCSLPCKYTQWSNWGSWNTGDNGYQTNKPRCSGNGAEAEQTIVDRAFNVRNSYPQDCDYQDNCKRAFLDGRNDYGDYFHGDEKANHNYRDNQQCFRVFETKESFQQVDLVINKAKTVVDSNWSSNSNNWFSNDVWYSLTIIKNWLLDGLYMDRDHAQTLVTIQNIDNVLEHFGWIQDWYRGKAWSFSTNWGKFGGGNRDCWVNYDGDDDGVDDCAGVWRSTPWAISWGDYNNLRTALDWNNVKLVNRGDRDPEYNHVGDEPRADGENPART